LTDLKQNAISIPFSSLNEGRVSFNIDWHPEQVEHSQIAGFPESLKVDVQVTRVESGFLVNTGLKGRVKLFCNRCQEEFQADIKGSVDTFFTTDAEQCLAENESEVRLIAHRATEIDLTPDVLDILLLAIPAKCLCSSDCLGLCSTCGADLNKEPCSCENDKTDPRWDTLRNISFEE